MIHPFARIAAVFALAVVLGGCSLFEAAPMIDFDAGAAEDTGVDATVEDAATDASVDDGGTDAATDASVDDGGTDAATDMAPPVDMDPGCTDVVEPIAATRGMVCEPKSGDIPADCDPVLQTGCAAGTFCDLSLLFENGMPTGFAAECKPYDCETRTKAEGEACSSDECMPGTRCQAGICRRFCRYEDAEGCAPTQHCTSRGTNTETFGYCRDTCS